MIPKNGEKMGSQGATIIRVSHVELQSESGRSWWLMVVAKESYGKRCSTKVLKCWGDRKTSGTNNIDFWIMLVGRGVLEWGWLVSPIPFPKRTSSRLSYPAESKGKQLLQSWQVWRRILELCRYSYFTRGVNSIHVHNVNNVYCVLGWADLRAFDRPIVTTLPWSGCRFCVADMAWHVHVWDRLSEVVVASD